MAIWLYINYALLKRFPPLCFDFRENSKLHETTGYNVLIAALLGGNTTKTDLAHQHC